MANHNIRYVLNRYILPYFSKLRTVFSPNFCYAHVLALHLLLPQAIHIEKVFQASHQNDSSLDYSVTVPGLLIRATHVQGILSSNQYPTPMVGSLFTLFIYSFLPQLYHNLYHSPLSISSLVERKNCLKFSDTIFADKHILIQPLTIYSKYSFNFKCCQFCIHTPFADRNLSSGKKSPNIEQV